MTNRFNISELARLAKAVLDTKLSGQDFMLEDVCNVTRAAYERYPEDSVIKKVAFTIEKMAEHSKPGATISQAEITSVYNNFADLSGNSKFRTVLGHLLLGDKQAQSSQNPDYTKMNRVDAEDSGITTDTLVDQAAVKPLIEIFGGDTSSMTTYDAGLARRGVEFVAAELKSIGQDCSDIKVIDGDDNMIVYAANFNTTTGTTAISIPVEIKDGTPLFPSAFLAGEELKQLTAENLIEYIASQKTETDFDVITAEARPDVDITPDVEMPKELAHIAKDFEDGIIEAASAFGADAINKGKTTVAMELAAAGFKNAQVKFGSESADSVIYLAAIHTPKGYVSIEVPVEMHAMASGGYSPLSPAYFAYDGLVEDFTAPKLQRFALRVPQPSSFTTTCSTAYSYMTLPEIKDEIVKSASENDYVSCEEALAKINEKFTEEDFKNAVADYHNLLMHKTHMEKHEQVQCPKLIPAGKGSIYARCGCTGLSLDKVAKDESGRCVPKTTLKSNELNPVEESGAEISSNKLYWT